MERSAYVSTPAAGFWSTTARSLEPRLLAAILLVATSLLGFAELAGNVSEGDTRSFDERFLLWLRDPADPADPLGPAWLLETVRDFTALGSMGVLTLVTLGAAGFLVLTGRRRAAGLVLTAVVTGTLLSNALKWGFDRPRPDLVPHAATVFTRSFPSSHAMLSAIVWLTLGAMVARVQERRRVKVYVVAMAALVTFLVGASRVYLGVHWPSDVLAGWMLGAAWALLCWLVMLILQRRGAVEPSPQGEDPEGPA